MLSLARPSQLRGILTKSFSEGQSKWGPSRMCNMRAARGLGAWRDRPMLLRIAPLTPQEPIWSFEAARHTLGVGDAGKAAEDQ